MTGGRFALSGSANLRTNKNQEQFSLSQDAELAGLARTMDLRDGGKT